MKKARIVAGLFVSGSLIGDQPRISDFKLI